MNKMEIGDYIQDILEAIEDVKDFTDGMQFKDFIAEDKWAFPKHHNNKILANGRI